MKKNTFVVFISLLCITVFFSCEQEKTTYQDLLNEEQIIIENFIKEHGLMILKEYPKDSVFGDKEFVLLRNGVYLHVIDYGNGNPPISGTKISSIAKGKILNPDKTEIFNGFQSEDDWTEWPLEFKYGESYHKDDYFLGDGFISALEYVGNGSSVSMIVPFSAGSSYQNRELIPIYFEKVNFTFAE